MAKYIDVDKVLEYIKLFTPNFDGETTMKCVETAIKNAPTADVAEVVRCKDCKHRNVPYRCALWYAFSDNKHYFLYRGAEFSCSYGERNET